MEDRIAEPPIEVLAAAFGFARRVLSFALRAVRLADHAHMEMVVVAPPRPHLVQEGAILAGLAAERLLDRRVDENALDLRILGGRLDHGEMAVCPDLRVDV